MLLTSLAGYIKVNTSVRFDNNYISREPSDFVVESN